MATLFNQMFNPDKGRNRVPVHAMYGLIIQAIDGQLDSKAFELLMDGTPECKEDLSGLFEKLLSMTTIDRYIWAIRWHSQALLADLSDKYTEKSVACKTDEEFKNVMAFSSVVIKE
jgi:hypothetical protein